MKHLPETHSPLVVRVDLRAIQEVAFGVYDLKNMSIQETTTFISKKTNPKNGGVTVGTGLDPKMSRQLNTYLTGTPMRIPHT